MSKYTRRGRQSLIRSKVPLDFKQLKASLARLARLYSLKYGGDGFIPCSAPGCATVFAISRDGSHTLEENNILHPDETKIRSIGFYDPTKPDDPPIQVAATNGFLCGIHYAESKGIQGVDIDEDPN